MIPHRLFFPSHGPDYDAPTVLLRDEAEAEYFRSKGGAPEAPLIEWALQFIKPDEVFVDVGAHVGTWTLTFAKRSKHVHAFEPQRSTFYRLCAGVALSDLDNVTVHQLALSDDIGTATLHHVSLDGGGSHLGALPGGPSPIRFETVPVTQLDATIVRHAPVGLIKIDTEGHELQVLRGAESTLRCSGMPRILLECWRHEWFAAQRGELMRYLANLGYRAVEISGWPEMLLAEHLG